MARSFRAPYQFFPGETFRDKNTDTDYVIQSVLGVASGAGVIIYAMGLLDGKMKQFDSTSVESFFNSTNILKVKAPLNYARPEDVRDGIRKSLARLTGDNSVLYKKLISDDPHMRLWRDILLLSTETTEEQFDRSIIDIAAALAGGRNRNLDLNQVRTVLYSMAEGTDYTDEFLDQLAKEIVTANVSALKGATLLSDTSEEQMLLNLLSFGGVDGSHLKMGGGVKAEIPHIGWLSDFRPMEASEESKSFTKAMHSILTGEIPIKGNAFKDLPGIGTTDVTAVVPRVVELTKKFAKASGGELDTKEVTALVSAAIRTGQFHPELAEEGVVTPYVKGLFRMLRADTPDANALRKVFWSSVSSWKRVKEGSDRFYQVRKTIRPRIPGRGYDFTRRLNAEEVAQRFLGKDYLLSVDRPTFFKDIVGNKDVTIQFTKNRSITGKANDPFILEAMNRMYEKSGIVGANTMLLTPQELISLQQASHIVIDKRFIKTQGAKIKELKQNSVTYTNAEVQTTVSTQFERLLEQHGALVDNEGTLEAFKNNIVAIDLENTTKTKLALTDLGLAEGVKEPRVGTRRYMGLQARDVNGKMQNSIILPEDEFEASLRRVSQQSPAESARNARIDSEIAKFFDNPNALVVYKDLTDQLPPKRVKDFFQNAKVHPSVTNARGYLEHLDRVKFTAQGGRALYDTAKAAHNLTQMAVVSLKQGEVSKKRIIGSEINRGLLGQLEDAKKLLTQGGIIFDIETKIDPSIKSSYKWKVTQIGIYLANAAGELAPLHGTGDASFNSRLKGGRATAVDRAKVIIDMAKIFETHNGEAVATQSAFDFNHFIKEIVYLQEASGLDSELKDKLEQAKLTFQEVMRNKWTNLQLPNQMEHNLGRTNQQYLSFYHLGELESHTAGTGKDDVTQAWEILMQGKKKRINFLSTAIDQLEDADVETRLGIGSIVFNTDPRNPELFGSAVKITGLKEQVGLGKVATVEYMRVEPDGSLIPTGGMNTVRADSVDLLARKLTGLGGEVLAEPRLDAQQMKTYKEILAERGDRLFRSLNPGFKTYIDDTQDWSWDPERLGSLAIQRLKADMQFARSYPKDAEKVKSGVPIAEVVANRMRATGRQRLSFPSELESYYTSRYTRLLADPYEAMAVFSSTGGWGKIIDESFSGKSTGGVLKGLLAGNETLEGAREASTKVGVFMNMLFSKTPLDGSVVSKQRVSRVSWEFDGLNANINFGGPYSDPIKGVEGLETNLDRLAVEALFGNFTKEPLAEESITSTEKILARKGLDINKLRQQVAKYKLGNSVETNSAKWLSFVEETAEQLNRKQGLPTEISGALRTLKDSHEFASPIQKAMTAILTDGSKQENQVAKALNQLLDSAEKGEVSDFGRALRSALIPFTKGGGKEIEEAFAQKIDVLDVGKFLKHVSTEGAEAGSPARQVFNAAMTLLGGSKGGDEGSLFNWMTPEDIDATMQKAVKDVFRDPNYLALDPAGKQVYSANKAIGALREANAAYSSFLDSTGSNEARENIKILHEVVQRGRVKAEAFDAEEFRQAQHRVVMDAFTNGARYMENVHVPLMAVGGALALMAAYSPQDTNYSVGNLTAASPDPILRTSGLPGESTPHTVWHQDISPFMVNISFTGTIENETRRKQFMNEVYDSISNTMRLVDVSHNVQDNRQRSHKLAARDLMNRF